MSIELLEKAITENHKATSAQLEALTDGSKEARQRLLDLEQKISLRPGLDPLQPSEGFNFGDLISKSEEHARFAKGLTKEFSFQVPSSALQQKTILNQTGTGQTLVGADRLRVINPTAKRMLRVEDLIPHAPTDSNLIEYAKENVYTNLAGPQFFSPTTYEGITKPESNITFTLASAAVSTYAHWIGASRQVLGDSKALQSYINTMLLYGLRLAIEDAILNGDGTGGAPTGLMTNATAYAGSGAVSADTQLDSLRRAIAQLQTANYEPSGIVVNPIDWMKIELVKDTAGKYIFGDPSEPGPKSIWGIPVAASNSIAATRFLVGDFDQAAMVFDREEALIRVAEQHSDWFVRNLVAILCERRLALAVLRPLALVRGNFL